MQAAIEFEAVSLTFLRPNAEPLTAVNALTLAIEPGQVYGLLGPNGSGKTSTVNLLCGLLRPSAGRIRLLGVDVTAQTALARARLGVVPQETALYNDLSAVENLDFHARLYGVPARERAARIAEVLDLVGLTSRRADRVGTYSGGMQRRLALARALMTRPEVVILDEPTLGVDVQSRAALWERIRQIAREGHTVLLTTNYMEEAQALANRLTILDRGQVVASGTPDDLQRSLGRSYIEIEADLPDPVVGTLSGLQGVTELVREGARLRVVAREATRLLPQVMDALHSSNVTPRTLALRQPDLNDVFLELTGRALRD